MRASKFLIAAMVGAMLLPAVSASADPVYEPGNQLLYMRNDGTGCPGNTFLAAEAGANEVGCGYVGGAPFGELYHAGVVASTVKTYATQDAVDLILDASRNLVGVNRVVATATTNRMAVGQVRVDVTVTGTRTNGSQITLGTSSAEQLVNPTNSAEVDFPFTMDLADALDKTVLKSITVAVDIRGWHVLTGYHRLNGQSRIDLPILIEVEPAP